MMFASDHANNWHWQVPDEPTQVDMPDVVELGPSHLPPRYRKQWNKQKKPYNTMELSPNSPILREAIDVVDETNTDNNGMASAGLDTDKREIYETDSNSESDSESDDSSLIETIPLMSRPSETNVSTITVDLEHLNATARGVMNGVHASKHEIKRPHRRRLVMKGGSVRHPLEGVTQVQIPKSAYNTARRVLVPESLELPLVTVSMRADLQFFHRQNR